MTNPCERSIPRDELLAYLAELLPDETADYCPNGLQVEGAEHVARLVTGVSGCLELFSQARQWRAQAVLVHHGIFWSGDSPILTGMLGRRVRELMAGELNLIAYHLPLDRHPRLGNNALAVSALGLEDVEPFAELKGLPVGFKGRFPEPIPTEALERRCHDLFGQPPLLFSGGRRTVSSLGMISGAAQRDFHHAIAEGLDAFITGEVSEWVMHVAQEAGVAYLAAGHYATERLGVRALGEHLAERFGIEARFIDLPNPV